MSNTQGERPTSLKARIIGGSIAAVLLAGLGVGGYAIVANAQAGAAAHQQLMSQVKTVGATLTTAAADDAALNESAVQASQVKHIAAIVAEQEAARVAAEQAAAAKVAAALAAQQAAQEEANRQAAADQPSTSDDAAPTGPIKCPAGSQANSGDGPNDTSCLPEICFHIQLPDPSYPQCETPFKP
ncbi:hypothetical protein [Leifsonia aquatica]|uniref:hypothetical protein n=1 Tax=Leifsonia aquatica TaxID=144185 RepID=UPI0013B3D7E7|nr:hypothetical protein [Leifsonia aquatica]